MRYLHLKVLSQDITSTTARLLRSRARRYRVHPRRPSLLQRYTSRARGWITIPPLEYRLDLIRVVQHQPEIPTRLISMDPSSTS